MWTLNKDSVPVFFPVQTTCMNSAFSAGSILLSLLSWGLGLNPSSATVLCQSSLLNVSELQYLYLSRAVRIAPALQH